MVLIEELKNLIQGEVAADDETLKKYSKDASLFEVKPQVVVFPKNSEDIKKIIQFVSRNKPTNPSLSLTARSAGTDMTGGPLTESIVLDFTKYFNQIKEVKDQKAVSQPGVFYRDFEKETLKHGWLLPSFPASKEICAIGGMVANNSGGEMTLKYGKTENYIESIKIILSDGEEYELKKLTRQELEQKMSQKNLEGEIYRKLYKLLDDNYDIIQKSKIDVNKNSSGYNIWKVWDREKQEFDLTRLIAGSQGTLGIVTETNFRLIQAKKHSGLLVIFLKNLTPLPDIVNTILPLQPVSFESFDDHTLKLAIKFFWGFAKSMGTKIFSLAFKFLPEFIMILTGGTPKLILLAEFEGNTPEEINGQLINAQKRLANFPIQTRIANTEVKAKKYWAIRHESFNLLRNRVKDKRTAPFIDDLIVKPEYLPEFLPKLYAILDRYELLYTIAGHVGDGNFHIIPLMKLTEESEKQKIFQVLEEVNKLIIEYHGSFSAEHNDGLIRSPYLKMLYGEKIYAIFEEIKNIFDPQNIFNPGKKVGANLAYAKKHIVLTPHLSSTIIS